MGMVYSRMDGSGEEIIVHDMHQYTDVHKRVCTILAQAKSEILQDIRDERVPETIRSFSELHDYVAAEEYGGLPEEGGPHEIMISETDDGHVSMGEMELVHTMLDHWIKGGIWRLAEPFG